jgi:acetoin utilization deacetylase AcuC-like enzyme
MHQFPFYPGTGADNETGRGEGAGFTVNLPVEAHATDGDYQALFAEAALPIIREFQPDLLLVSAGFDAHERDPLGGMRVTTAGYRAMTSELRALAEESCAGRIALITEGGYDLQALGECIDAAIAVLASDDPPATAWPATSHVTLRGSRAVAAARAALGRYWRF